jgi:L-arabinose transport system ATP-binding protein
MSTYVRDLGPAERQLVEIGKAVTHPTGLRLVAFDEPTSSLTEEATAHLFSVIAGLRASGVGIIYVTHRMREVFELADTIVVLRDGHSVATLAADQTTEDEVVRLMVGRDLTAMTRTEPRARNGDADRPPTLAIDSLSAVGLHDVSLTIHAGEVLGIAGLAKSGRSRLARCVFGDIPQKSGTVALFGKPLNRRTPHSSLKAGIALVPEDRHAQGLVLALSVTKNLTLGAVDRTLRTGRVVRTGRELMSASSTAQRLQIKAAGMSVTVDTLSGGNQQKVVLGRALSHQPALLILDEPTRGIDVGAKAEIYRLIRELASAGTAIMLISSELPELLALSDRIAVMQAGRIVGEVSGSEATEESVLSLAMPKSN